MAKNSDSKESKSGGKKKFIVGLALVAIAAVWFLYLSPSKGGEEHAKPVAGEVLMIDPIQVNLEAGHYLRIGVALQLVEGHAEASGAQALDATISTFSGRSVADVNRPETRAKLKADLLKQLKPKYHDTVMDVYFTDYVTQ